MHRLAWGAVALIVLSGCASVGDDASIARPPGRAIPSGDVGQAEYVPAGSVDDVLAAEKLRGTEVDYDRSIVLGRSVEVDHALLVARGASSSCRTLPSKVVWLDSTHLSVDADVTEPVEGTGHAGETAECTADLMWSVVRIQVDALPTEAFEVTIDQQVTGPETFTVDAE